MSSSSLSSSSSLMSSVRPRLSRTSSARLLPTTTSIDSPACAAASSSSSSSAAATSGSSMSSSSSSSSSSASTSTPCASTRAICTMSVASSATSFTADTPTSSPPESITPTSPVSTSPLTPVSPFTPGTRPASPLLPLPPPSSSCSDSISMHAFSGVVGGSVAGTSTCATKCASSSSCSSHDADSTSKSTVSAAVSSDPHAPSPASSSPSPASSSPSPASSSPSSASASSSSDHALWTPASADYGAKTPIVAPLPADSRLIVRLFGQSYDLTDFRHRHPGGSLALEQLHDQDATDLFLVYHPESIVAQAKSANTPAGPGGILRSLHVADHPANATAAQPYTRTPMQQDFDEIIARLTAEGKFVCNKYYYLRKFLCQALLLAGVVAFMMAGNHMYALSSASTATNPTASPVGSDSLYMPAAAPAYSTSLNATTTTTPTTTSSSSTSFLFDFLLLHPNATSTSYSFVVDRTLAAASSWHVWIMSCLTPYALAAFALYSLSAFLLGFFWQQIAFLGHDVGHNQLTGRQRSEYLYAWIITAFFGVSVMWWKRNHNVHHIYTNSVECDPDIQHLPVFAIDSMMFPTFYSTYYKFKLRINAMARWFVSRQHKLFYVVMAVARLNLYVQSFALLLHPFIPTPNRFRDLASLALFWTWHVLLLSMLPSATARTWYVLFSHAVCGLIHVQITLSHFAMPTYYGADMCPNDRDHFFRTQFASTLNVSCPEWLDWLHGGLQFQLEHHLLPRLPRHNLRYCMDTYIKPFAAKHGLPYHERDFISANRLLMERLRVAAEAMQEECRRYREGVVVEEQEKVENVSEGESAGADGEARVAATKATNGAVVGPRMSVTDSHLWQAMMAQG